MRILHTADIHLREYNDFRWQALAKIVELAAQQAVDVVAIAGDLFDSDAAARRLRPQIRRLFAGLACPVLIISGNHDAAAYSEGLFLGDTVQVIHDFLQPVAIGEACFWGFPYQNLSEEELLEQLYRAENLAQPDRTHLLLFHGELADITHSLSEYGEETQQRYLPVKLASFASLPWQYVLAGHFHTRFDVHEFREGAYFVYPGSPVSLTRRECGERKVNILEPGKPPHGQIVETRYFQKLEIRLDPLRAENPLKLIREKLSNRPPRAQILLTVSGFFNGRKVKMSEEELRRAVEKLAESGVEIEALEFQDIRRILEDDLLRLFAEHLRQRQLDDSEKREVMEAALRAMLEL